MSKSCLAEEQQEKTAEGWGFVMPNVGAFISKPKVRSKSTQSQPKFSSKSAQNSLKPTQSQSKASPEITTHDAGTPQLNDGGKEGAGKDTAK